MPEPSATDQPGVVIDGVWPDHPELVRLYEAENSGRDDHDFYLALIAREGRGGPVRVVDIGCGTGAFAVTAAGLGHEVIGVDPAGASIDFARHRPGGNDVTWLLGEAGDLPTAWADVALMMGHVAQYFVGDDEWAALLGAAFEALGPGGLLAFEARDPRRRGWQSWATPPRHFEIPGGSFQSWCEPPVTSTSASGATITTTTGHTILPDGRHLIVTERLVFRSREQVEEALRSAGFDIERIDGTWAGDAVTETTPELIVQARRPVHPTG